MTDPKSRDLDYVPQPKDLHLEEEVTIGGRTTTGTRARLYSLLRQTAAQARCWPIGKRLGPAGWLPGHVVTKPWAGASSGKRRLRELRTDFGCDIESKSYESPDGETTRTTLYRLRDAPAAASAAAAASQPAHQTPSGPHRPGGRSSPPAHKPAHPAAARSARTPSDSSPLGHLEVWLVDGHPGGLADHVVASMTAEVTPGQGGALAGTEEEILRADDPREAYRLHLNRLHQTGKLVRLLSGHRRVILWSRGGPCDALDVLRPGLEHLGATVRFHAEAA